MNCHNFQFIVLIQFDLMVNRTPYDFCLYVYNVVLIPISYVSTFLCPISKFLTDLQLDARQLVK